MNVQLRYIDSMCGLHPVKIQTEKDNDKQRSCDQARVIIKTTAWQVSCAIKINN